MMLGFSFFLSREICEIFYAIKDELKKKGFNSFNKDILFWNVYKRSFLCWTIKKCVPSKSSESFSFVTLGKSGSFLDKANMMIVSKEATD